MNVHRFEPRKRPPQPPRRKGLPLWNKGVAPALLILAGAVLLVLLGLTSDGATALMAALVVVAGAALTQANGPLR